MLSRGWRQSVLIQGLIKEREIGKKRRCQVESRRFLAPSTCSPSVRVAHSVRLFPFCHLCLSQCTTQCLQVCQLIHAAVSLHLACSEKQSPCFVYYTSVTWLDLVRTTYHYGTRTGNRYAAHLLPQPEVIHPAGIGIHKLGNTKARAPEIIGTWRHLIDLRAKKMSQRNVPSQSALKETSIAYSLKISADIKNRGFTKVVSSTAFPFHCSNKFSCSLWSRAASSH